MFSLFNFASSSCNHQKSVKHSHLDGIPSALNLLSLASKLCHTIPEDNVHLNENTKKISSSPRGLFWKQNSRSYKGFDKVSISARENSERERLTVNINKRHSFVEDTWLKYALGDLCKDLGKLRDEGKSSQKSGCKKEWDIQLIFELWGFLFYILGALPSSERGLEYVNMALRGGHSQITHGK